LPPNRHVIVGHSDVIIHVLSGGGAELTTELPTKSVGVRIGQSEHHAVCTTGSELWELWELCRLAIVPHFARLRKVLQCPEIRTGGHPGRAFFHASRAAARGGNGCDGVPDSLATATLRSSLCADPDERGCCEVIADAA
jgi:hypothetical protein